MSPKRPTKAERAQQRIDDAIAQTSRPLPTVHIDRDGNADWIKSGVGDD